MQAYAQVETISSYVSYQFSAEQICLLYVFNFEWTLFVYHPK